MLKDKFTKKAKKIGYRARSAYKLKGINDKFNIIESGYSVLDLGCWPGGWLIVSKELGANFVLGVDKKKIDSVNECKFIEMDVMSDSILDRIKNKFDEKFDVVLSDLAPNTTGIRELDKERSFDLSKRALEIAIGVLKRKGSFLCKIFWGRNGEEFIREVKRHFYDIRIIKPKGSKKRSMEVYVLCRGFRG